MFGLLLVAIVFVAIVSFGVSTVYYHSKGEEKKEKISLVLLCVTLSAFAIIAGVGYFISLSGIARLGGIIVAINMVALYSTYKKHFLN